MKRILLGLLIFVAGCISLMPKNGRYSIGRDPTWFPLDFKEMTVGINAFTNELVAEMAKIEKKPMALFDVAWNQLIPGLEEHDYAGILTSIPSNLITEDRYTFSDPFLLLGPVLVVPEDSKATSLDDLKNTTVGTYMYDNSVLIVQEYPSIVILPYSGPGQGLEQLARGETNGALVPALDAQSLVSTQYKGRLKIVTKPLDDRALKLVTLKGHHKGLIKRFNSGLKKLQENGTYAELGKEFGVSVDSL